MKKVKNPKKKKAPQAISSYDGFGCCLLVVFYLLSCCLPALIGVFLGQCLRLTNWKIPRQVWRPKSFQQTEKHWENIILRSEERRVGKECRSWWLRTE